MSSSEALDRVLEDRSRQTICSSNENVKDHPHDQHIRRHIRR